ncbi:phage head completion protein [Roseibium sp. Sym1]|uniref:phage head completion protein n=1 Tax=Roseibium sp. Sym1 TaxID=3016006 RepID=UPI0022B3C7BB|nr:putative Ig domain-containing protein [Roseibium sp. Sym1]
MRAGAKNQIITIQHSVVNGISDLGELTYGWQSWRDEVFCEVMFKRGKEHFDAGSRRRFSEVVCHFRCEYDDVVGLSTDMQILYDGGTYDIRSAIPHKWDARDVTIEATLQNQVVGDATLEIYGTLPTTGTNGTLYQGLFQAQAGAPPYTFSLASGALPAGLSVDSYENGQVGILSGTPTETGTFADIVLRVTDSDGDTADLAAFDLTIS